MSDPKYNKKTTTLTLDITYHESKDSVTEEKLRVHHLIDKAGFESLPDEIKQAQLKAGLQKISPRQAMGIYGLNAGFSYGDERALAGFDYGNILIEAYLPYCLHLPNEYELEVLLSPPSDGALLIPKKIWTHKATSDGKLSDEVDFFAEGKILHFKNSDIITPRLPHEPKNGWSQDFTGTNLQKIKDRDGSFRYTCLYIQFNYPVKKEDLDDKDKSEVLLAGIREKALDAVNKLIDSYRYVTQEEYVTRLGNLSINMIYFTKLNEGLYTLSTNIESATMNRSKEEIEKIEEMLIEGNKPDLPSLLLLDARNSFDIKNYPLAIVQSFQALDIFVENFLIQKLQTIKGLTEQQAVDHLTKDNNWKTKTRLKEVLRDCVGYTLEDKNKTLWNQWCVSYKDVRNDVIHKGKEATRTEVENALKQNIEIIELLKNI